MDFLLEALTNWLKEMLVGGIMSNLSGMFDSVNQQVADISVQVGQTPQGWNGSIFNMIENLSNSIMVPIAGVILAIVMTVDLIQMIADKNNLHDVDTWMIFKWVFKSAAAILIVTNTWNIVMGVFDMAQSVVAQAAGIINSDASIDISSVMTDLEPRLMEMDLGPLFGLWFQSLFIGITMWALETPVYPHSAAYASEHGEMAQYNLSYQVNSACKEAIEQTISAHYAENRLDTEAAVKDVLEKFGTERVQFILANTIQHKNHDGRISQDNKAWAKTIPTPEDSDASRHCAYLVVDGVNPGLTDLFTRQARKTMQEQQKSSVLQKLRQEPPARKPAAPKKQEPER